MKGRSMLAILLCITLFAATALARPVTDTSKPQRDIASSGAQIKPDFFWFRPRPHLPGPWWWFIRHHKPGFSPAPHAAPHSFPKWHRAHPPFPHFHIPKKPHDQSQDLTSSSSARVHPDFFFRHGPMLPWWWLIRPLPHSHNPWFPQSPRGAPHKFPKWPIDHPPLPHFPTPQKPPGHLAASAGLQARRSDDIEAAIEKCWKPLAAVGNCVYDILSAFTTGTVEFDSACCTAINKMENDCVASFNNQEFTDTLSNYCSTH